MKSTTHIQAFHATQDNVKCQTIKDFLKTKVNYNSQKIIRETEKKIREDTKIKLDPIAKFVEIRKGFASE